MVSRIEPRRYDIVHDHGGAWPGGGGRPQVRTLHFSTAGKMTVYLRRGRLKTLLNPGNWRALREEHASVRGHSRLIAVSERVRRDFARFHGLDPARALVIPNGASFAPPGEDRASLRARYNIADQAPVLLTIGRADYVKGYDLLARAWRRSALPPAAVWVTVGGDAPGRAPGRIITGPLPHNRVIDWIHAADFGALPSYYEGCSVALLEMLAGGLFTLSHDVGNASEVIREGQTGRILPPSAAAWIAAIGAAVGRPLDRPTRALDPGFAWPTIAARVEEVYRETLALHAADRR
jgi:glycosyltransferase involved in cell wall biosynthesis